MDDILLLMKYSMTLFLDESGKAQLTHSSKHYVLSSCSVPQNKIQELRLNADKIIFKYWGSSKSYTQKYNENRIVFHARDIFHCNGPFIILKNQRIRKEFWDDVYGQILSQPYISYYMTIVDKSKVKKIGTWKTETTLLKTYKYVIGAFIKHVIARNSTGEIIAESSYDQDVALVNILSGFQRSPYRYKRRNYTIGEIITSLSLVNKHDNEIGSQLADLMAWTGKNKYTIDNKETQLSDLRPEERKLLNMYNKKLKSRSHRDNFHSFVSIP